MSEKDTNGTNVTQKTRSSQATPSTDNDVGSSPFPSQKIPNLHPTRKLHKREVWLAEWIYENSDFFHVDSNHLYPPFNGSEASKPLPPKRSVTDFPECRVPLTYFGLPPVMVQFYAKKGITHLYEWQSRCLLKDGVLDGQNVTYSAPTSGGKTLVAEILLIRRTLHNPNKNRALIILPYVSLVIEKYEQLHSMLKDVRVNGEKIKIGSYYGTKVGVVVSFNVGRQSSSRAHHCMHYREGKQHHQSPNSNENDPQDQNGGHRRSPHVGRPQPRLSPRNSAQQTSSSPVTSPTRPPDHHAFRHAPEHQRDRFLHALAVLHRYTASKQIN